MDMMRIVERKVCAGDREIFDLDEFLEVIGLHPNTPPSGWRSLLLVSFVVFSARVPRKLYESGLDRVIDG